MRYIKFSTLSEAQAVADRIFTDANADGRFAPGTTAYAIPEKEEYFTVPILEGFDEYFTNEELSGAEAFKEEKVARPIIDDLKQALKNSGLTVAQIDTLMLTTLLPVSVGLLVGAIRVARNRANSINTTALYTAQRKAWLLARMDEEIAKL
jgi:hypothetical protein